MVKKMSGSLDEIYDELCTKKMIDGYPIVPPTRDRVDRMLEYTDRDRNEIVGEIAPSFHRATIEEVAINAVMAGCRAEYFPVVLTAMDIICDPKFLTAYWDVTTSGCWPFMVVNGPIRLELDINSGHNVFGFGWRANVTIGRAVTLCLINLGGTIPGVGTKSTLGLAIRGMNCIAENEERLPNPETWPSLHVERGFNKENSCVTLLMPGGQYCLDDEASPNAKSLLTGFAWTIGNYINQLSPYYLNIEPEVMVCLCPEHALMLNKDGYAKKSVKRFLYEHARVPLHYMRDKVVWGLIAPWELMLPKWLHTTGPEEETLVPIVEKPEDILVIVAGGAGPHSAYFPTGYAAVRAITRPIALKDGTPIKSVEDFKKYS